MSAPATQQWNVSRVFSRESAQVRSLFHELAHDLRPCWSLPSVCAQISLIIPSTWTVFILRSLLHLVRSRNSLFLAFRHHLQILTLPLFKLDKTTNLMFAATEIDFTFRDHIESLVFFTASFCNSDELQTYANILNFRFLSCNKSNTFTSWKKWQTPDTLQNFYNVT